MARQRIVAAVGTRTVPGTRVPQGRRQPASEGRPSGLARIFAVPDGEPIDARLAHIRQLTPGERLWFEAGGAGRRPRPRALRAPRRREAGRPRGRPPDAPLPMLGEGGVRPRGGAARPRRGPDGDRALPRGGSAPGRGPGPRPSCSPGPRGSAPSRRGRTAMRSTTPSRSATTSSASRTRVSSRRRPPTRPTPTPPRRRSRRRSPGACSGRSTRRGCAALAAAPRYVADDDAAGAARVSALRDARHVGSAAARGVPGVAGRDRGLPDPDRPGRPRPSALRGAPAPGPGRRRLDALPDPPGRARRAAPSPLRGSAAERRCSLPQPRIEPARPASRGEWRRIWAAGAPAARQHAPAAAAGVRRLRHPAAPRWACGSRAGPTGRAPAGSTRAGLESRARRPAAAADWPRGPSRQHSKEVSMAGINCVFLLGRLTRDPRSLTPEGAEPASAGIAHRSASRRGTGASRVLVDLDLGVGHRA